MNHPPSLYKVHKKVKLRGFILPLTMLICTIVLIISSGITVILSKELYFSKLNRQSQLAYYAADDGLNCTLMIDDKYVNPDTGLGIFPHSTIDPMGEIQTTLSKVNIERQSRGLSSLVITDIRCATSAIFDTDPTVSNFTTTPFSRVNSHGVTENGQASSFSMKMDLGDGNFRCANITMNKTSNYRQVISRGYASCLQNSTQVERAVLSIPESI